MKTYTETAVQKAIDTYIKRGGAIDIIEEGCLLSFSLAILHAPNLKYIVIKEQYLNEWSSAYVAKQYNKLPKKYQIALDKLSNS